MNELKTIVEIAKKMGGSRGGEIQLEGRNAYVTNTKRTSLYHFIANSDLGTGSFYSNQAIMGATDIVKKGDRVYFYWKEKGVERSVYVPCLEPISEEFEKRFKADYIEQQISFPKKLIEILQSILVTKLEIKDKKLIITQTRSDGTVGFNNEMSISSGLTEMQIPDAEEISIFTSDLSILLLLIDSGLAIAFNGQKPLSVYISYPEGKLKALIGTLEYTREE